MSNVYLLDWLQLEINIFIGCQCVNAIVERLQRH